MSALGSAMLTSPRNAKLAATPPVVGCRSTRDEGQARVAEALERGRRSSPSASGERMPSCMRAPPEAWRSTTGSALGRRALEEARHLLAGDRAHAAAHEREDEGAVGDGPPPRCGRGRSRPPRAPSSSSALGDAIRVALAVAEAERVGRARGARPRRSSAPSSSRRRRQPSASSLWCWPQSGQTSKRGGELARGERLAAAVAAAEDADAERALLARVGGGQVLLGPGHRGARC